MAGVGVGVGVGDHHVKSKGKSKRRRELVKVVYISSPMKVKTSASRFRSLVQELTGRDSDISRFDDVCFNNVSASSPNATYSEPEPELEPEPEVVPRTRRVSHSPFGEYTTTGGDSLTSSDSLLDDVFNSDDMVERLEGMFPSTMFYSHLINVPNNY